VIGRVADYLQVRLQNYRPQVTVVHARQRGTPYSSDDPAIVEPLLQSDLIFMGPGSPSYAVRQLQDSLAWDYLLARHRLGAALVLASAAVVSVSTFALPVYEIYKVGEDLHWKRGLDFFGVYGIPLVFIPHWNNNDGGVELDTSRCFMGQKRFARLMRLLPAGLTVIGIDEKTALMMDVQAGECHVSGLGGVTLIHTGHGHDELMDEEELHGSGLVEVAQQREAHVHQYGAGETFPLTECCALEVPKNGDDLPDAVWQLAVQAAQPQEPDVPTLPPAVQALVEQRQAARLAKDWAASDALRDQIAALGWIVKDTRDGPIVEPGER
jgi:cyanophycinase-like exopeptidase